MDQVTIPETPTFAVMAIMALHPPQEFAYVKLLEPKFYWIRGFYDGPIHHRRSALNATYQKYCSACLQSARNTSGVFLFTRLKGSKRDHWGLIPSVKTYLLANRHLWIPWNVPVPFPADYVLPPSQLVLPQSVVLMTEPA